MKGRKKNFIDTNLWFYKKGTSKIFQIYYFLQKILKNYRFIEKKEK